MANDGPKMSLEYRAAWKKHDEAIAVFKLIRAAFSKGTISIDAYLTARATYGVATAEYDAVYSKEKGDLKAKICPSDA